MNIFRNENSANMTLDNYLSSHNNNNSDNNDIDIDTTVKPKKQRVIKMINLQKNKTYLDNLNDTEKIRTELKHKIRKKISQIDKSNSEIQQWFRNTNKSNLRDLLFMISNRMIRPPNGTQLYQRYILNNNPIQKPLISSLDDIKDNEQILYELYNIYHIYYDAHTTIVDKIFLDEVNEKYVRINLLLQSPYLYIKDIIIGYYHNTRCSYGKFKKIGYNNSREDTFKLELKLEELYIEFSDSGWVKIDFNCCFYNIAVNEYIEKISSMDNKIQHLILTKSDNNETCKYDINAIFDITKYNSGYSSTVKMIHRDPNHNNIMQLLFCAYATTVFDANIYPGDEYSMKKNYQSIFRHNKIAVKLLYDGFVARCVILGWYKHYKSRNNIYQNNFIRFLQKSDKLIIFNILSYLSGKEIDKINTKNISTMHYCHFNGEYGTIEYNKKPEIVNYKRYILPYIRNMIDTYYQSYYPYITNINKIENYPHTMLKFHHKLSMRNVTFDYGRFPIWAENKTYYSIEKRSYGELKEFLEIYYDKKIAPKSPMLYSQNGIARYNILRQWSLMSMIVLQIASPGIRNYPYTYAIFKRIGCVYLTTKYMTTNRIGCLHNDMDIISIRLRLLSIGLSSRSNYLNHYLRDHVVIVDLKIPELSLSIVQKSHNEIYLNKWDLSSPKLIWPQLNSANDHFTVWSLSIIAQHKRFPLENPIIDNITRYFISK